MLLRNRQDDGLDNVLVIISRNPKGSPPAVAPIQQQVLVEVRALKQEVEQFNQKFDNFKKQHSELCN